MVRHGDTLKRALTGTVQLKRHHNTPARNSDESRWGVTMEDMQRKIFWGVFISLGLLADIMLPLVWGLIATLPIGILSWWVAYRSDWF